MRLDDLTPRERSEAITAYLDGELSPEDALHVTAWLDAHPDALREVEHVRRTWDVLGAYEDAPVPPGFAARVSAAAGAREARTLRFRLAPRPVAAAAAALLVVGAGAWLLASRGTEGVAPAPASLERIDVGVLQHADLDELLSLSDEQFEAVLLEDPEDAPGVQGG
jgi:anti-sigma factor RsiW